MTATTTLINREDDTLVFVTDAFIQHSFNLQPFTRERTPVIVTIPYCSKASIYLPERRCASSVCQLQSAQEPEIQQVRGTPRCLEV